MRMPNGMAESESDDDKMFQVLFPFLFCSLVAVLVCNLHFWSAACLGISRLRPIPSANERSFKARTGGSASRNMLLMKCSNFSNSSDDKRF